MAEFNLRKILVIRFSSIGDIILTTPVIRVLASRYPEAQIHFVTKQNFAALASENKRLYKVHVFANDIGEVLEDLKSEKFDLVVDLHKNLRSYRLKRQLKVPALSFDKINLQKFMAVNFKMLNLLPDKHIIDRYFEGLAPLEIKPDNERLEFYIPHKDQVNCATVFFNGQSSVKFIALVVGGSYYTKKIPVNKLQEICRLSKVPVVVLGGKEDKGIGDDLKKDFPQIINTCGTLSVSQSGSVIQQAEWVITSDTGMMHIAAAFGKTIFSAWGNTIPEFGMYPYKPVLGNKILEVKGLPCRPCSKLGYGSCPLGHFKCMNDIDYSFVADLC